MRKQRTGKRFNPLGVEVGKITETADDFAYWRELVQPDKRPRRNPKFVLERLHRKTIELSFVLSLVLTMIALFWLRGGQFSTAPIASELVLVQVEEIPVTKQERRTPPPPRPQVAMPSDDLDLPEEETISISEIQFDQIPEPPAPPVEVDASTDTFVAFDTPPVPVGGWQALYQILEYPTEARKAGIEGRVLVNVEVDAAGKVVDSKVLKGIGIKAGLEQAAMRALEKLQFKPALQRDKPVRVWITVPVRFALTASPS